ncbi:hypothetical protein OHC50_04275 [Paenarthrobacter ilicis]|uniref:hypothetical protein n=1 Tax=Paenarthrobacter ilicis TaxID=43665 RepID=UPI00300AE7DD
MIKKLLRAFRSEMKYQLWGGALLLPFGGLTLALVFAFTGSITNVGASLARLETTVDQAAANGFTLTQAMDQPSSVVIEGGQRLLDNPLRFDYESAFMANQALQGSNAIGTGLEMITFLVLPLLFFVYGCGVATGDARRRILKDRVVVHGSGAYITAKVFAVVVVSVLSVVWLALLSLTVAPAISELFLGDLHSNFPYAVEPAQSGAPVLQVAFSTGVGIFFGLTGFFVGLAVRSTLLPSLAAGGLLMVAPFAGSYDPRNILTAAGQNVFTYWGGFSPRPPYPVAVEPGLLLLMGCLMVLGVLSIGTWVRIPKFD